MADDEIDAAVADADKAQQGELDELRTLGQELKTDLAAAGYAACRTSRFVSESREGPDIRIGSVDRDMRAALSSIGDAVRQHMETVLLPFRWSDDSQTVGSDHPFLSRLPAHGAVVPGVGFPVRLGIMGNGFVAFFGRDLDLGGDRILEIHRRAYRLMRELLLFEVRYATPRQSLNDRELQCLQLAADGLKSDAIARELELSVHTVNAYLGSASDKLDAVNRIQAIAKAIRLGFIG